MILKDFAEERGESSNTIFKYIKRHQEISQHTSTEGKNLILDDIAVKLLDKKYKLPAPVEIVEDLESRKELLECHKELTQAYKTIAELSKQIADNSALIAQAEAVKILLEERDVQLQRSYAQYDEIYKELQAERSKTWWDKLRRK